MYELVKIAKSDLSQCIKCYTKCINLTSEENITYNLSHNLVLTRHVEKTGKRCTYKNVSPQAHSDFMAFKHIGSGLIIILIPTIFDGYINFLILINDSVSNANVSTQYSYSFLKINDERNLKNIFSDNVRIEYVSSTDNILQIKLIYNITSTSISLEIDPSSEDFILNKNYCKTFDNSSDLYEKIIKIDLHNLLKNYLTKPILMFI